jgi:hypothetical protein
MGDLSDTRSMSTQRFRTRRVEQTASVLHDGTTR